MKSHTIYIHELEVPLPSSLLTELNTKQRLILDIKSKMNSLGTQYSDLWVNTHTITNNVWINNERWYYHFMVDLGLKNPSKKRKFLCENMTLKEETARTKAMSKLRKLVSKTCESMSIMTKEDKEAFFQLELERQRLIRQHNMKFDLDHIIPVSMQGSSKPKNLQITQTDLNYKKGSSIQFIPGYVWDYDLWEIRPSTSADTGLTRQAYIPTYHLLFA